jgi:hypothetical protein
MRRRARWWWPRHFGDLGGVVHLRVEKVTPAGPRLREPAPASLAGEAVPSSKGRSCSGGEVRGGRQRRNGRGDVMRGGGPKGSR